jgi:hypothetical protein
MLTTGTHYDWLEMQQVRRARVTGTRCAVGAALKEDRTEKSDVWAASGLKGWNGRRTIAK